jgi:pyruvate ferredoxin oxidoreductase beta subunit
VFGQGKNVPLIAMAHGIPYVATASVADLRDLEEKVGRAMTVRGRALHPHPGALPARLGRPPHDTIKLARLAVETGLFPLFEAEHGEVVRSTPIRHRVPVEEYLKPQKRFAHLFGKVQAVDTIARIQAMADRNIRKYRLVDERRHG